MRRRAAALAAAAAALGAAARGAAGALENCRKMDLDFIVLEGEVRRPRAAASRARSPPRPPGPV